MLGSRFGSIVQGIVRVALASSLGATAYACSSSENTASAPDGGAALDDEGSFACATPLSPILEGLTPATPVDYVEIRGQSWIAGSDGGAAGAPTARASRGTACAGATNHDACLTTLSALALGEDKNGWYDGDGGSWSGGPSEKQFVVFTRGDMVGALYSTADMAAFLGSIDSIEEARLLLATKHQPLVCTTMPAKSGWRANDDGSWELLITGTTCGTIISYQHRYRVAKDGSVTEGPKKEDPQGGKKCGRRPEGLAQLAVDGGAGTSLTAHLVESAYLEAASVVAFRRLELELRRFGAPEALVARARRARVEEIDHARETARLARRHGGVVPALDVKPMERRELLAIALENAVEGCVHETYGALAAAFQAERCAPELRPLHRRIAREEASHAELAHDVARWLDRKLTPAERAQVADARARALASLFEEVRREPAAEVVRVAGLPTAAEARVLVEGLDRTILAAAA